SELGGDAVEQVVQDPDARGLPARAIAVVAGDADPAGDVADDVVSELDLLDHAPRAMAVLVARREEDGVARLRVHPVVLEEVVFDAHAPRVLQLEDVLARPARRRRRRRAGLARRTFVGETVSG